jgi:hypothetical protein
MRQPIEDGLTSVSRAVDTLTSRFMLVSEMDSCGYDSDPVR